MSIPPSSRSPSPLGATKPSSSYKALCQAINPFTEAVLESQKTYTEPSNSLELLGNVLNVLKGKFNIDTRLKEIDPQLPNSTLLAQVGYLGWEKGFSFLLSRGADPYTPVNTGKPLLQDLESVIEEKKTLSLSLLGKKLVKQQEIIFNTLNTWIKNSKKAKEHTSRAKQKTKEKEKKQAQRLHDILKVTRAEFERILRNKKIAENARAFVAQHRENDKRLQEIICSGAQKIQQRETALHRARAIKEYVEKRPFATFFNWADEVDEAVPLPSASQEESEHKKPPIPVWRQKAAPLRPGHPSNRLDRKKR
jgi:hypothetical protein